MKHISILVILIALLAPTHAQNFNFLNPDECTVLENQQYGEYERNKFDLVLPKQESTHGLVVFIHGGGFKHGDKKHLQKRKDDIYYFVDNNIAVASINYRFYNNNDSLGVNLCLRDVKRAIQYFRFNAETYNIDKSRVGCYGISAGAGSSLYLAFHDDMAIEGDTTILGESTRIQCAGAISTQATYNLFDWKKIIPFMRFIVTVKRKTVYNAAANFYGYPDYKSFKKNKKQLSHSLDMLEMIDRQAPPIYLMNLMQENFPKNDNVIQHHRKHAVVLSKKLDKYAVENYLVTKKEASSEKEVDYPVKEFLVEHLK